MFVNSPLGVSCDTNSGLGMGGRCNSLGPDHNPPPGLSRVSTRGRITRAHVSCDMLVLSRVLWRGSVMRHVTTSHPVTLWASCRDITLSCTKDYESRYTSPAHMYDSMSVWHVLSIPCLLVGKKLDWNSLLICSACVCTGGKWSTAWPWEYRDLCIVTLTLHCSWEVTV